MFCFVELCVVRVGVFVVLCVCLVLFRCCLVVSCYVCCVDDVLFLFVLLVCMSALVALCFVVCLMLFLCCVCCLVVCVLGVCCHVEACVCCALV